MEKKQNVPALRFQGFSGEWEKYNLSMLSGVITKGTTPLDKSGKGDVNFIKIENIDANTGAIHVTQKISQEEHNGYLKRSQLKENDILFSIAGTLGRVAVVKANLLPANTNQALAIIRLKKGNFQYVKTYLQGKAVENFLKANPTVGAQPNLSLAQVGDLEVVMPEESKEQENISDFFQYWDELIFHTMAKIKRLRQFRQAMLAKLFPREGAAEPELRFRGFSSAWEKRKVKDILIERNEQAPKSEEYPLKAFIANEGIVDKGKRYDRSALVTDTEAKLYKKTQYGDFIYSSNNLETGSIGLNKYGNASISPVYSIFYPTELGVSDFIGYRLVRKDFIREMVKWRQGVIYGQWRIPESDFLNIDILVPSIEEQRKIGSFFRELDDFISLQQKKLERMQRLKAALLEKLFV